MRTLPGTWSVGEMATVLRTTRDAIEKGEIRVRREEDPDFGPTLLTTFTYDAHSQRWFLDTNSHLHWLPFEGRVWTSVKTGEILRISWVANDVPTDTGVAQVLWTIDFQPVDLASRVVALPQKAVLQITYKTGQDRIYWNVSSFSEYRRYGSDSAVHFDE
jgi:hypothetical protein